MRVKREDSPDMGTVISTTFVNLVGNFSLTHHRLRRLKSSLLRMQSPSMSLKGTSDPTSRSCRKLGEITLTHPLHSSTVEMVLELVIAERLSWPRLMANFPMLHLRSRL